MAELPLLPELNARCVRVLRVVGRVLRLVVAAVVERVAEGLDAAELGVLRGVVGGDARALRGPGHGGRERAGACACVLRVLCAPVRVRVTPGGKSKKVEVMGSRTQQGQSPIFFVVVD